MGLRDCLNSAVAQGAITRKEASDLGDDFEDRFAQYRAEMGDASAAAKARQELEAGLRNQALEKRRNADLTEASRITVKRRLLESDDIGEEAMGLLSHYGYRGGSSVRGHSEAIIAASHAKLSDVMRALNRTAILGRRPNKALQSDLVDALHGKKTGDATANSLGESIAEVFEDLRQRFNAAGGAIGKLDNFGLPHSHDRLKVKDMGRDPWKALIRPLLDLKQIKDPLTGQLIAGNRVDELLNYSYDNIVSEGRAHLTPNMLRHGKGALSGQRMDERILHFKDGATWISYHQQAGRGDITQVIFNHINGMAKDIAAMEILGPNPQGMVEYIKQSVAREIGRKEAGLPSLRVDSVMKASQAKWMEHRIDALYQALRGNPTVVSGWANITANINNVLTAAQLSGAAIPAVALDPLIAAAARNLSGLPLTHNTGAMLKALTTEGIDTIVRSGVMWDEYLHVMGDELRFAGPAVGSEWSRWIADRAVTWSGLKPLTTARKLVEARSWQGHIADLAKAGTSFAALDPRLKRTFDGFGIEQTDWDIWTKATDQNGFVTPREIELNGGNVAYLDMSKFQITDPAYLTESKALAHRRAAEKLIEMTTSWSERSVPSGTINSRSLVTGVAQRGTIPGEMFDYMLRYKSFGLSFTALQLEAIGEISGTKSGIKGLATRSGLAYFAALTVPLTIGASVALQLRTMSDGKDPEDMTTVDFWSRAALSGGGFGLFGDFVKANENRFGQGLGSALLGPGIAFLSDSFSLTLGNAMQGLRGEKMQIGREVVQYAGRYMPVLSSHWAVRGAYRRLVLDNLQWMVDPEADKQFKAQAARAKKNGTEFFMPPGAMTPSRKVERPRAPDFSGIGGG